MFLAVLFSQFASIAYGDDNWPIFWVDAAVQPTNPPATIDTKVNEPCDQAGSIIECENQVLREALGLTGTGLTLNYSSARVLGRKSNTLIIPLSGAQLPASVTYITLNIDIAGRRFGQTFPPQPNQKFTFTWDGLDAFGRRAVGHQTATIRIGYAYNIVYATPAQTSAAFGRFGVTPTSIRVRGPGILYQEYSVKLSVFDARTEGLAAWSLSAHHSYDPNGKILYLGDGTQRQAQNQNAIIINRVAGNGLGGAYSGDGGPALSAGLYINIPSDVVASPDGSLFIADNTNGRIRRVGSDGIITTVAGIGNDYHVRGDGGPATAATLNSPRGIAFGPDGSLYIADPGHYRVRRVGPDGIITTVAGTGVPTYDSHNQIISNGDGGPATAALLSYPLSVAVGPDGSLYIADSTTYSIRRVGPDGIITTVAGTNQNRGYSTGDGGLATQADIIPSGVSVGADGSLYIAEQSRIRRVGLDGIITTVAGIGPYNSIGEIGDGGLATSARLGVRIPS
jgi:sugar lactone lactonase YvrE